MSSGTLNRLRVVLKIFAFGTMLLCAGWFASVASQTLSVEPVPPDYFVSFFLKLSRSAPPVNTIKENDAAAVPPPSKVAATPFFASSPPPQQPCVNLLPPWAKKSMRHNFSDHERVCSEACYVAQPASRSTTTVGAITALVIACRGDVDGAPAAGRVFYVNVSGSEHFIVDTQYHPESDEYRGEIVAWRPGELQIEVHARYIDYSGRGDVVPCGDVPASDGDRRWDPIRVGHDAQQSGQPRIAATLTVRASAATAAKRSSVAPPRCIGASNEGRWVPCDGGADCEVGATHQTWRDALRWEAKNCAYVNYTRPTALAALRRAGIHNIVLAGDSQMRTAFATLYDFLLRDTSDNVNTTSKTDFSHKFQHMARACGGEGASELCLYFSWCDFSWVANATLEDGVARVAAAELAQTGRTLLGSSTALFANTGQWLSGYACANVSARVYADAATWLARLRRELSVRAFFGTIKPAAQFFGLFFGRKKYRLTSSSISALDAVLRRAMKREKVPLLDVRALALPRLDTVCDIGGHFGCAADWKGFGGGGGSFFAASQGVGAMKGPVVFAEVQLMLNAMVSGPATGGLARRG